MNGMATAKKTASKKKSSKICNKTFKLDNLSCCNKIGDSDFVDGLLLISPCPRSE
jgi:hypothetical protein